MRTATRVVLGALAVLAVGAAALWFNLDKETRGLLRALPTNRDVLFWTQAQRDAAFRAMDRIPVLARWHTIAPSATPGVLSRVAMSTIAR